MRNSAEDGSARDAEDMAFYRWNFGRGVDDIDSYSDEVIREAVSLMLSDRMAAAEVGSEVRVLLDELGVFDPPMKRARVWREGIKSQYVN